MSEIEMATSLERQIDRIERQMLTSRGVLVGDQEPPEVISTLVAAIWDESLHPRGRDGKFIEKFGFVKGMFNWVKDAGDSTNPMSKGTQKKADRVKIVGFSSGQGGSTNNPWVKVEYDGPDPDLKGKVGFARANEVEEAAAQKARIDVDLDDVPDTPDEPDVQALRDRVHQDAPEADIDQPKSRKQVRAEAEAAWAALKPGDVFVADDGAQYEVIENKTDKVGPRIRVEGADGEPFDYIPPAGFFPEQKQANTFAEGDIVTRPNGQTARVVSTDGEDVTVQYRSQSGKSNQQATFNMAQLTLQEPEAEEAEEVVEEVSEVTPEYTDREAGNLNPGDEVILPGDIPGVVEEFEFSDSDPGFIRVLTDNGSWEGQLSDTLPSKRAGDSDTDTLDSAKIAQQFSLTLQVVEAESVTEALELLASGQKVRLKHREQVNVLVSDMAAMVQEARDQGRDAPKFNLCDVFIQDRSLFCANSMGIPRLKMPQLGGTPRPGSKADALPKNSRGRVDLSDQFREHLEGLGFDIVPMQKQASHLKASQNELDGAKVGSIAARVAEQPLEDAIFISNDDYVVDGHHRWASTFVNGEDNEIPVAQVSMDILSLLAEANRFADDWGIAPQDIGTSPDTPDTGYPDWDPRGDADFLSQFPSWEADSARVDAEQTRGLEEGFDTEGLYDRLDDIPGNYSAERIAQHEELIDRFLSRPEVKREKKVLFIGGLPGAGKTTLLNSDIGQEKVGVNIDEYITVNPDEVKLMMAEMGMYPDWDEQGLDLRTEGEAATLVHEESSYLSKIIMAKAFADDMNVIVDTSGKKPEQFLGLQEFIGDFGETDWNVKLVLADVPAEVAMQRAIKRYYQGERRYTPLDFIAGMRTEDGKSKNYDAFQEVKGLADEAYLFDNVDGPRLVEQVSRETSDSDLYDTRNDEMEELT